MGLPKGVTGFRHDDDEPLPVSNEAVFRAHCFTAARLLSGRVLVMKASSTRVINNYSTCILELPDGSVTILLNAHHPIIGFAEPPSEGDVRLRFVDAPKLVEVFRGLGDYNVIEALELNRSVSSEDTSRLGRAELEQVKYWKPSRLGDLIFNFWD